MQKELIVVDYQPAWAEQFEAFRQVFARHLQDGFLSIEHVGSTSVPGLAAKPILDMDIIVEDDDAGLDQVIRKLEKLGYRHVGDQGVPGREAVKPTSEFAPVDGSERHWPRHHLYVCRAGVTALRNHLVLRDHLRAHPEEVRAYSALKKQLARQFRYDIDAYIGGKTDFIIEILKKNGFIEEELKAVRGPNLS